MLQPGFFDLSRRYESLDAKPDPLVALNKLIPWEEFRPKLIVALEKAGLRAKGETRKSAAGRKPLDEIVMFKVLVLQSLYNLGDDNTEYLIRDRLSFMRFLGLGLEGTVPDAKTIWLYREALARDETAKALFEAFEAYLKGQGYLAMGGQIVDATIVPVPKSRNTPEENVAIKAGEIPKGWAEQPAKLRQKDRDARWTKKHGQSLYGYRTTSTSTANTSWCANTRSPTPRVTTARNWRLCWTRTTPPPMFGATAPTVQRKPKKS